MGRAYGIRRRTSSKKFSSLRERFGLKDGAHGASRHVAPLDAGRRLVESRAHTVAASRAAGAQGAFRRAAAARWQFPLVVRGPRAARVLDEFGGRRHRPDARAAGSPGNDLGGGRCVAPVDRGVRRAAGARHGLEECLGARAERRGAGHGCRPLTQFGRMCATLGIQIIAASSPQAKGRVERNHGTHQDRLVKKLRRLGDRRRSGRECIPGDDLSPRAQRSLRAGGRRRADDFHRRTPSRRALDRAFQLEETRVLSNDWVIRYDTRYFQIARQSGHAPARSTVVVRENAAGAIERRYRGRVMHWSEIPAPPPKPAVRRRRARPSRRRRVPPSQRRSRVGRSSVAPRGRRLPDPAAVAAAERSGPPATGDRAQCVGTHVRGHRPCGEAGVRRMTLRDLVLRLRALAFRRRVERELDEELDFHIAREAEKHIVARPEPRRGLTRSAGTLRPCAAGNRRVPRRPRHVRRG